MAAADAFASRLEAMLARCKSDLQRTVEAHASKSQTISASEVTPAPPMHVIAETATPLMPTATAAAEDDLFSIRVHLQLRAARQPIPGPSAKDNQGSAAAGIRRPPASHVSADPVRTLDGPGLPLPDDSGAFHLKSAMLAASDPEFQEIAAAWPKLPMPARQAVLLLVRKRWSR